jgi:hypothetical protein
MKKAFLNSIVILSLLFPATSLDKEVECSKSKFFRNQFAKYCNKMKKPTARLDCETFTKEVFCK